MARQSDKRERLVAAADRLIHMRGYERSSIADIAAEAGVPAGNVYYYFKTKDDIARAVVEARMAKAARWLEQLDKSEDPLDPLLDFIDLYEEHRKELSRSGSPVASLCLEANHIGGSLADSARDGLGLYLSWLETRFRKLGQSDKQAHNSAAHVLGALEGATLLAGTCQEAKLIKNECKRLRNWLKDWAEENGVPLPADISPDSLPS